MTPRRVMLRPAEVWGDINFAAKLRAMGYKIIEVPPTTVLAVRPLEGAVAVVTLTTTEQFYGPRG